jgi:2,4-dienoyl-CoA reductase-like NADH-dependent reductase (Old Yellow Enzyme family)
MWTHKGMRERMKKAAPSAVKRVTLRAGAWAGGKRAPFAPVWNRELFSAAKGRVSIPVFAVGGIRTAEECDEILDGGAADMVGIGRPFYAEPDLAARILRGGDGAGLCRNSNHCVPAQMLGMKGTCYNPEVVKLRRRAPGAPA